MVEPFYDNKDAAKLAAQQAALAAPKLPVRPSPFTSDASTTDVAPASTSTTSHAPMAMGTPLIPSITRTTFFFLSILHYLGYDFHCSVSYVMEILLNPCQIFSFSFFLDETCIYQQKGENNLRVGGNPLPEKATEMLLLRAYYFV